MSTAMYSPPPESYTRKLLEQILSFNTTDPLTQHGCYKLSAINASKRRGFINVILRFDILSHIKKNLDEAPLVHCIDQTAKQPELDDLQDEQEEGRSRFPNAALIICGCVIALLFLVVLVLRCRSYILRRYKDSQENRAPRFWYVNETGQKGDRVRKHPDRGNVRTIGNPRGSNNQPANLFCWSEDTPVQESAAPDLCDSQMKHWNRTQAFRQAQEYADRVEKKKRIHAYLLKNTRNSPSPSTSRARPAGTDSDHAHLAAGYREYYKRQGKVLSDSKRLSHGCSSSSKRNITQREMYQLSGSSGKTSRPDSASPRYSIQSVRTTQPHNKLSRNKLDKFNASNNSFSSQSKRLTGQRRQILSTDSEQSSVPNASVSVQVGTRSQFTCESTSDLQWRSNDRVPMEESPFETDSDSRGSLFNTSLSSNNSTGSNGAVFTLNIPTISVSSRDEQTMVFFDERSNKTFGSNASIQGIKRPAVCLYSARKRTHQKAHPQHNSDHNMHLGLVPYSESPKSAATLTPVNSNKHTPTHATGLRPHSHSAESESWSNLKGSEAEHFPDAALYLSRGSTLSPPHSGCDLPDVYLYPPSMSSLQSMQGSLILPPYSNHQSAAQEEVSASHPCVSMRIGELASNGYERREASSSDIYISQGAKILVCPDSLGKEKTQLSDLAQSRKQSSGIVRKELLHQDSKDSRNSSVDFSLPALRNEKRRQVSPKDLKPPAGRNMPKRIMSLALQPKKPKSLSAELHSIFEKHYERTGVRMLAPSPVNPPRSYLDSNPGVLGCANRNTLEKRRRGSCFEIDHTNLRRTSGVKATVSAKQLNCFRWDHQLPKKNTQSLLSSPANTALLCKDPAIESIPLATGLQKNILRSAPPLHRSSSSFPKALASPIEVKKAMESTHIGMQKPRMRYARSSANIRQMK